MSAIRGPAAILVGALVVGSQTHFVHSLRPNGFTATTSIDLALRMGATSIRTYDLVQIEAVASCSSGLDVVAGVVSSCPKIAYKFAALLHTPGRVAARRLSQCATNATFSVCTATCRGRERA